MSNNVETTEKKVKVVVISPFTLNDAPEIVYRSADQIFFDILLKKMYI